MDSASSSYLADNRRLWDVKTAIHADSDFYNVQGFIKGDEPLRKIELALLPDVKGKKLLHLQCHFGLDTLAWARRGAEVTGVDFSPSAIDQARSLAETTGLGARFVCSDVLELDLGQTFDIVFTSYGVLGWLPDIEHWARVVARHLSPGGILCLVEAHSVMYLFNEEGVLHYPYFGTPEPDTEITTRTYTDGPEHPALAEHFWIHTQEEILQAVIAAGLSLKDIRSYPFFPYPVNGLTEVGPQEYVFPNLGTRIPYVFSLLAEKSNLPTH